MTQTAATPTSAPAPASGLRSLYLIRVIFSLIWVVLVFTTSASLKSADTPTGVAAVLLIIYPLWGVVATLLERRMAGTGSTSRVSAINMALGLAATIGMIIAAFSTVGTALLVFGIWALLSGAIQLVAVRRRRTMGAQWPMIISGGLSTVAGYSALGAFWFLLSVISLSRHTGRAER